jgi:hypothetical protein
MYGGPGDQMGGQPGWTPGGGGPAFIAQSKVAGPAIGLIVTAGIGIALQALGILFRLLGMSFLGSALADRQRDMALAFMSGGVGIFLGFLGILVGIVILLGALRMKALENYGFAMTATILAMIPCISPCCLLGLPIGIWALVVLLDQNVKSAFRS